MPAWELPLSIYQKARAVVQRSVAARWYWGTSSKVTTAALDQYREMGHTIEKESLVCFQPVYGTEISLEPLRGNTVTLKLLQKLCR